MSENIPNEISELKVQLLDIKSRLEDLETKNDNSFNQRMSYLTWCVANPISLIFIPTILIIGLEICINNWGIKYTEWTFIDLTKGTNWTIPLLVATVGLIVSLGNKLY